MLTWIRRIRANPRHPEHMREAVCEHRRWCALCEVRVRGARREQGQQRQEQGQQRAQDAEVEVGMDGVGRWKGLVGWTRFEVVAADGSHLILISFSSSRRRLCGALIVFSTVIRLLTLSWFSFPAAPSRYFSSLLSRLFLESWNPDFVCLSCVFVSF